MTKCNWPHQDCSSSKTLVAQLADLGEPVAKMVGLEARVALVAGAAGCWAKGRIVLYNLYNLCQSHTKHIVHQTHHHRNNHLPDERTRWYKLACLDRVMVTDLGWGLDPELWWCHLC